MPKTRRPPRHNEDRAFVEFGPARQRIRMPILFEDRGALAIDKPAGWLLVPFNWQSTQRNLQAALASSIAAGDYWARSRNIKYLRHVHRLDGDTSGILLFGRSPGAVESYARLFEERQVSKRYLAVVEGCPGWERTECNLKIAQDENQPGRVRIDPRNGKDSQTYFEVLETRRNRTLIEARPITGRTHQIRVHLSKLGLPIVGDVFYGRPGPVGGARRGAFPLALRAVSMSYRDPFRGVEVSIVAPKGDFLREFGFTDEESPLRAPLQPVEGSSFGEQTR